MPTYQYACTECGHAFEQFQNFSDDALTDCPECAGRLRKLFNAVGVVFKGSGFYRNDSRSDGKSGGAGTSGSNGSSTDGSSTDGSSSSADAKPDAKSETKPAASSDSKSTSSDSKAAASA